jgi:hypothetical protein
MESNKDIKICMVTIVDGKAEDVEHLLRILKRIDPRLKSGGFELIVSNQYVEWWSAEKLLIQLQDLINKHKELIAKHKELSVTENIPGGE